VLLANLSQNSQNHKNLERKVSTLRYPSRETKRELKKNSHPRGEYVIAGFSRSRNIYSKTLNTSLLVQVETLAACHVVVFIALLDIVLPKIVSNNIVFV
jgi:hypothetical protein